MVLINNSHNRMIDENEPWIVKQRRFPRCLVGYQISMTRLRGSIRSHKRYAVAGQPRGQSCTVSNLSPSMPLAFTLAAIEPITRPSFIRATPERTGCRRTRPALPTDPPWR